MKSNCNITAGDDCICLRKDNLTVFARKPTYLALANINGLFLDNIRLLMQKGVLKEYDRSVASINEAANGAVRSLSRQPPGVGGEGPIVNLHNCRRMLLTSCVAPAGTSVFLEVSGEKTSDISLVGNDLSEAEKGVSQTSGVRSNAVRE